jgi:hypothetical protein
MTNLRVSEMKALMDEVMEWTRKCEEMEMLAKDTTGETANAYASVHTDYKWKLKQKIGKLWFYICGSDDMNPFLKG